RRAQQNRVCLQRRRNASDNPSDPNWILSRCLPIAAEQGFGQLATAGLLGLCGGRDRAPTGGVCGNRHGRDASLRSHSLPRLRVPPPFGSVGMVKSELSVTCPSGNCPSPDSILIPSVLPSSVPTSNTTRLLHALSSSRTRTGSPTFQRTGRGNSYSQ